MIVTALTAVPAAALVVVHLFAGRGPFRELKRGAWLSFSGGAAAAYIFLYLLPILNDMSYELAADDGFWPDGEWIFVAALAGTCVFHVIEVYARRGDDSTRPNGDPRFWAQIGAFALYNVLVGALFVVKPYASTLDAIIYQSALILHFAVIDLSLRERHPQTYDRFGRWIMAGAVVLGWGVGHFGITHLRASGLAFAFLAGGMILNVLKEELSETARVSLVPFAAGAGVFALLFLVARMST